MAFSKNAPLFCGLTVLLLISAAPACAPKPAQSLQYDFPLAEGWLIRWSAEVEEGGAVTSAPGMDPAGWYPASVPTTVLAALLKNGEYPDPFVGKNLESIPRERFSGSWWYRKEFELPADKGLGASRPGFD